jgi:DNA polymerase-3 subunit delta
VTNVYLVQGADPVLRDREAQRLVETLLEGNDRALALEEHTIPARRGGDDARDDEDDDGDGDRGDVPAFAAILNALHSPPFITPFRVVVVRDVGGLPAEQARRLATWVEQPADTVRLVLVAGGGRVLPTLEKACRAHGAIVGPASEQTAAVLSDALQDAQLALTSDAAARVADHLGDDAGRVPELVALLESTFGPGATLDLASVEAYLGDAGTVGRFELTNAIDRGDVAGALEVLHRSLSATSARQPRPLHPMQVMATLAGHYRRLLRLDDPSITTREQAATALGMRSASGARFPLEASRRLGTTGLREAVELLARAELDLRGHTQPDERIVIEVLVARLAALSRRHAPARAATRSGRRGA